MVSKIVNIDLYNERMSKSLEDKAFFLKYMDADVYLDYGCADGQLIQYLERRNRFKKFFGYDNNSNMLSRARMFSPNSVFSDNYEEIIQEFRKTRGTKAVILSSIIHEIYSYLSDDEIKEFWGRIFSGDFDYIIIRDMSIKNECFKNFIPIQTATTLRNRANRNLLESFEKVYGSVDLQSNFYHFLLKYHYADNWERELAENYVKCSTETLIDVIPNTYNVIYLHHFILPYIMNKVMDEMNLVMTKNTHLKLIMRKNS